jgi:hypothetical protein
MNRLSKYVVALCAVIIGWGVTVDRAWAQQELFMGGFDPKEWKVGHQAKDQNQIIIEFVRPEEKIDSWTELLTMQVLRKPGSPETIDVLVPKMHQEISKRCPAMTWNVINRQFASDTEEAGMLYEWTTKGCPPDADQHEIARVVYGKFNIFRLAYAAKTPALAAEKREKWIKELSTAKVVRR